MEQATLFGDYLDSPLKRFEDIHNYLYANDGLSEQQVLEEIVKILFIKYYDEQKNDTSFCITENESPQDAAFINRINQLFEETKERYKIYFEQKDSLKLSKQSLYFVVSKLQKINFTGSTQDANGMAFQKFLGRHAKGGRGQFFTPDPIIDFCVEIIQPKPNEKIIDPACGTGGFLFSTLNHIKNKYKNEDISGYVNNNIFGIEINRRVSQIAKIKFLIESNSEPNIICENSLNDLRDIPLFKDKISLANSFDIILTNPPFGSQGKITQKEMLAYYDLGHKWSKYKDGYSKLNKILKGQVPDVLFIEQCLNLLKPGGRMGIVLPNGHFENTSMDYVREYIKERAFVVGVVLLPQETFIPYGTGVKVSLLFLQKKNGIALNNNQVFFSKINKLGYVGNKNGTPIYKKDQQGNIIINNGKQVIDEDFTESINDYKKFMKSFYIKTEKSFSIESSKLNNRLDYNYYLPANRELIANLRKLKSVKLGEVATVVRNKSPLLKQNTYVEYVELSDVYTKSFEIINSTTLLTTELPSRASYEIKTGDIITAIAGNSIGSRKHATAYVTEEYNNAICTNGFRILRNIKINHYYLLYYLQSDLFLKQVIIYRTGAAIPAISDKDFFNILVYLPPQKEMDEIIARMEKGFKLRNEANKILSKIEAKINIKHITKCCT